MIAYITKTLKALNAHNNPSEIGHAFSFGCVLAFIPKDNILWYILFFISLFLRINKGALFLTTLLGSSIIFMCDPLFDAIGYSVLTYDALKAFFIMLSEIPFVSFTHFNNTIVIGSLVCSIALYIPLFVLGRLFVKVWRTVLLPKIKDSVIVKVILKMPLIEKLVKTVSSVEGITHE